MDISLLFTTLILLLIFVLIFSVAGLAFMMLDDTPPLKEMLELKRRKEMLRHEIYHYRLSSMLRYMGIHIENYVMKLPEEQIRKHIIRCNTCQNLSTCDRCLRNGETIDNMSFCPNYDSLLAFSKTLFTSPRN
ncbi:MAG: DUF6455 family protein [Gammaproteobacteria bacterium]|jgi:hypothetical protein